MTIEERFKEEIEKLIEKKQKARSNLEKHIAVIAARNSGRYDIKQPEVLKLQSIERELSVLLGMRTELDQFDLNKIYIRIAEYANNSYINELSGYISADYYYGQIIYDMMQKEIPLDLAIKVFEAKVKLKMKKSGLSEFATLISMLYFHNDVRAQIYENEYHHKRAIKGQPSNTIRNWLVLYSGYKTKTSHGITIVSKTDEGIKKLEDLLNDAYVRGDEQYLNTLSFTASQFGLCIGDISLSNTGNSYYNSGMKYIYLRPNEELDEDLSAFYHETTHFLDYVNVNKSENQSAFSVNNPTIAKILEMIKSKVNVLVRGLSLGYFIKFKTEQYINNSLLNQKWLDEIQVSLRNSGDEDIQLYMQQKRLYERKKYKLVITSIIDIYDGLANGKLYQMGTYGHGKIYYSDSNAIFQEFIANVGAIYNSGGQDVMYHEFGPELTKEIMQMYENFIGINKQGYRTR